MNPTYTPKNFGSTTFNCNYNFHKQLNKIMERIYLQNLSSKSKFLETRIASNDQHCQNSNDKLNHCKKLKIKKIKKQQQQQQNPRKKGTDELQIENKYLQIFISEPETPEEQFAKTN